MLSVIMLSVAAPTNGRDDWQKQLFLLQQYLILNLLRYSDRHKDP